MNEGIGNADRENVTQSLCWSYDMWVNCFERERECHEQEQRERQGLGMAGIQMQFSDRTNNE